MVAACPLPAPRGTPIRIYRMAEALAQRGHKVDVFTYHLGDQGADPPFNLYRIPEVLTYRKQDPGPSYQKLMLLDPLLAWKVLRGTGGGHYDVIHAHHIEGMLTALPSKWCRRLPLIFDVHTLLASELPSYRMGLPGRLTKTAGRYFDAGLPGRVDHVVCVSEEIRTHLREVTVLPETHFSTVPNGVEEHFFAAKEKLAQGAPSPMPNSEAPSLVYAGNLAAFQRIDLLLKAFAEARKARPDLRLRILTSADFSGYEEQARALGIRPFVDLENSGLDRLPGLLAQATVVANPRTECAGLPQKLLNYMAVGCPIVSFEGSARHIRHGESGLIARNDDIAAFAQAVVSLVNDPGLAQKLGRNAQAFARTNLSWPTAVERLEAIYAALKKRRSVAAR